MKAKTVFGWGLWIGAPFLLLDLFMALAIQPYIIEEFTVTNPHSQPVFITPITSYENGIKIVLSRNLTPYLLVPAWHLTDLKIEPGASENFYYDIYENRLTEFLVRDESGSYRHWTVQDPLAKVSSQESYTVPAITSLPKAPDAIAKLMNITYNLGFVCTWTSVLYTYPVLYILLACLYRFLPRTERAK